MVAFKSSLSSMHFAFFQDEAEALARSQALVDASRLVLRVLPGFTPR